MDFAKQQSIRILRTHMPWTLKDLRRRNTALPHQQEHHDVILGIVGELWHPRKFLQKSIKAISREENVIHVHALMDSPLSDQG